MNSRNPENRRSSIAPPARDARVSLGARGTQVNLSAGTAETLEETS